MLNYTRVGCQILVSEKKGMFVISCWGREPFGRFIGRTREGISISSSPDDVRKVYGEPSAVNESTKKNRLHLRYDDKALGFHFKNQQLVLISVEQPK